MINADQVLTDYIDAWNGGRRPRVDEYLRRVPSGPARDALADQITTFLQYAPTPELDEAARAEIRSHPVVAGVLAAAGDAPWPALVPRLRERAGLSVADVAARLVERLGLRREDAPRAAGYVQRLEDGELEPTRVSRRLLDALGDLLGAGRGTLADAAAIGAGLRPATAGGALFRAESPADDLLLADIDALSSAAMRPAPEPLDELDRLFTGGPEA